MSGFIYIHLFHTEKSVKDNLLKIPLSNTLQTRINVIGCGIVLSNLAEKKHKDPSGGLIVLGS